MYLQHIFDTYVLIETMVQFLNPFIRNLHYLFAMGENVHWLPTIALLLPFYIITTLSLVYNYNYNVHVLYLLSLPLPFRRWLLFLGLCLLLLSCFASCFFLRIKGQMVRLRKQLIHDTCTSIYSYKSSLFCFTWPVNE